MRSHEDGELLVGLDPLRAQQRARARREGGEGLDQREPLGIVVDPAYEAAVELDDVRADAHDVLEARVARARVVERDLRAALAQVGEDPLQRLVVGRELLLGDLDHDPVEIPREGALHRVRGERARVEVQREPRAVGPPWHLDEALERERLQQRAEPAAARQVEPLVGPPAVLGREAREALVARDAPRREIDDRLEDRGEELGVVEQLAHRGSLLVHGRLAGVRVDAPRLPASHALGLVERRVGEVEQPGGRVGVGRPGRDAGGAVQREAVDRQPADQRPGALGDAERLVGAHVGQQDPELLAAQAADEVVRAAHRLAQLGGHLAQHLVTVRVPAGVVEELEVVEVEHDDGGRARRADRVLERLVEAAVVGQAGQRVALRERLEPVALGLHERRHVVEAADERSDLARA